jgi:hypothetical protein
LLEQRPGSFDVREVLFALIFSATFFHQAMLAPDTLQCAVADGQSELADEPASAETVKRLAQLDELGF